MGGLRRCPDCMPGSIVDCGVLKRRRGGFGPLGRTKGSKTVPLHAALEIDLKRIIGEEKENCSQSASDDSEASIIGGEGSETDKEDTNSSDRLEHDFQTSIKAVEDEGDDEEGMEDEVVEDRSLEGETSGDKMVGSNTVSHRVASDDIADEIPGSTYMMNIAEITKNEFDSLRDERYMNMEEFVSENNRTSESIQEFRQFLSEVGFDQDELPSIEGLDQNWLEMNNDLQYFDWTSHPG